MLHFMLERRASGGHTSWEDRAIIPLFSSTLEELELYAEHGKSVNDLHHLERSSLYVN